MKFNKTSKNKAQPTMNEIPIVELNGQGMLCKRCGKELIGKEKKLCRSCSMELKDKGKKVLEVAGGIAAIGITIATGGKFAPKARKEQTSKS